MSYCLYVFDWDGTLTPDRATSTENAPIVPLPGVQPRLADLAAQGAHIAVATNQRGLSEKRQVRMGWGMFGKRVQTLCALYPEIGKVHVAVDDPERVKPAPGMLLELMRIYQATPEETLFVGDAETDREAANRAGCGFMWARDFFGWGNE